MGLLLQKMCIIILIEVTHCKVIYLHQGKFKIQTTKKDKRNLLYEDTVRFGKKCHKIEPNYLKNQVHFLFMYFSKLLCKFLRCRVTVNFPVVLEIPNKTNANQFESKPFRI